MRFGLDSILRLSFLIVFLAAVGCSSAPVDPKPKGELKIDPRLKISGAGGGNTGAVQPEAPVK